ncbi:MAG: CBS domain-containing protein [Amphritea sp.]|nr:CBS domain-containing protein [Amphritea sp.]
MITLKDISAGDIMTRQLLTVADHWSITTLIDFLTRHKITGAPVLSATRQLTGVVSLSDVMRFDSQPEETLKESPMNQYYHSTLEGYTPEELGLSEGDRHSNHLVREIMTDEIISVSDDTPVASVARTMADHGIHRVFVTSDDGVCGVISTLDILQLVAEN